MSAAIESAVSWRDQDPDAATRAELDALITAAADGDPTATADLESRFATRLEFGTAGLRGELGAGPNRMNRVLVSQAAAGLAAFLLSRPNAGDRPSVVIGYDGRTNSAIFATDSAEIMAGAGIHAILLPRLLPTPVLAFAVRHLGTSAGVMVTASHNPASDNGYKVYLGGDDDGSQIVAPVDAAIAAHIDDVARTMTIQELPRSDDYTLAPESLIDDYVERTAALAPEKTAPIRCAYTAMHGVGFDTASRVFTAAGFTLVTSVAEQESPNPEFPTVAFPNPEEPGAMDLVIDLAKRIHADIAIANDPDADRFAAAIPTSDGWRALTGNEVGALLGWRAAERLRATDSDGTLAASVVSSPALAAIAHAYNLGYAETLTGFKWVSRVNGLAYGYEEALGYLVDPGKVRDKDGISAAVDFLGLVSDLTLAGRTLEQHLDDFATTFGAFASAQVSLRMSDRSEIPRLMSMLRNQPPSTIGDYRVDRMDDMRQGFGALPPSNILRIQLDGGARVLVRPSGTEPKLKVYIDASCDTGTASERRATALNTVNDIAAAMRALLV